MQNKIYMTLAYLYEQIKGVVGEHTNLEGAIDHKANNVEEVINARKGYATVRDKIDTIDTAISNVDIYVKDVEQKTILNANNIGQLSTEIDIVRNTNPVVEMDNGSKLLVSLKEKPNHKTTTFSLGSGEQYRCSANAEHYVNTLYTRGHTNSTELTLAYKDSSKYDKSILENREGTLYAIQGGLIDLPLHTAIICNQAENNIATVPGLCDITAISNSKYNNQTNHLVSSLKSGYTWHLKTNIVNVIFTFRKSVWLDEVKFDFKANTTQQSVSISKLDVAEWVEINKVSASDKKAIIRQEVKTLRLTFNAMSESDQTRLEIKNIKITARKYADRSGLCFLSENMDIYGMSGFASLNNLVDIPDDSYVKYGISNQDDPKTILSYYPQTRRLESGMFYDLYGNYVIGKIDSISTEALSLDYSIEYEPIPGLKSDMAFENIRWDEDYVVERNLGFVINPISYLTLYVVVKAMEYQVTLNNNRLNETTSHVFNGVIVELELKNVNGALRVIVRSEEIIDSVKLVVTCLQNIYSLGDGNATKPINSSYSELTKIDADKSYNVESKYYCYKDIYKYKYKGDSEWGWHYEETTDSKYNQTQSFSFMPSSINLANSNTPIVTRLDCARYVDYIIEIRNTNDAICYIGDKQLGHLAYLLDCKAVPKNNISKTTRVNEFIGRLKKTTAQKVFKVIPDDSATGVLDIEYYLSNNNYNFYTYNHETNNWVITSEGMSSKKLLDIPDYALSSFLTGEDVFVKVKINSDTAFVNGVVIELDKGDFIEIAPSQLKEKGMNTSDLQNIDAQLILDTIAKTGKLSIISEGFSKLSVWPLLIPKIELVENGGVSWSIDNGKTAMQYVVGNTMIVKNTSLERRYYKLEQKYFTDEYVSVGTYEDNLRLSEVETKVEELEKESKISNGKFDLLDQNVNIVAESVNQIRDTSSDFWHGFDEVAEGDTSVDLSLPSFLIPTQLEIDLDVLLPGASTIIRNIKSLRYIQYWNTQKEPIPESIEHKTIKEFKHHFENEGGEFTPISFEMCRQYDTNNVYLMSEALKTNTATSFSTQDYTCTVRRSDGNIVATYGNSNVGMVLNSTKYGGFIDYYCWNYSYNAIYLLPGEDARWVDFDFDFVEEKYIHSLSGLMGGAYPDNGVTGGYAHSLYNCSYQSTSVFVDMHGDDNWIQETNFSGIFSSKVVVIKKSIRKLRIRLEVPYSYNRGSAYVTLKNMDINYCPVRYIRDTKAIIKPVQYYDTSTWKKLVSVHSDASIFGTTTDIRYLFQVTNASQVTPVYLSLISGSLQQVSDGTYNNGMRLFDFNNLTETQLDELLKYNYVRPIAILNSDDGLHTPSLRSFRITYAEKYSESLSMVNQQDIKTEYDKQTSSVIVTNATDSNKTLKVIIS